MKIECDEASRRIDYEFGIDWTLPSNWTSCVLQINAKKGTTFRLNEF
ncbi:MAG TPA: hypothetical protein VFY39_02715 [Gammaproteobacteria bacterium]|nr:hypothetical protein [Gammaproteobacteria bacterium]